jgi:hypothetical protein
MWVELGKRMVTPRERMRESRSHEEELLGRAVSKEMMSLSGSRRASIVTVCLLGSLLVYCTQVASSGVLLGKANSKNGDDAGAAVGADPTSSASADTCTPAARSFVKLAAGSLPQKGSVSSSVDVRGYSEFVFAQSRAGAGSSTGVVLVETALEEKGFYGGTGQVSPGQYQSGGAIGARLRVDGNFVRFSYGDRLDNSGSVSSPINYEVWGIK